MENSSEVSMVSMGNALRRLSCHIYNDLKHTLSTMQNQDPELRTIELRRFIFRTRKMVIQMVTVTKFLLSDGATAAFREFDNFRFRIDRINQVLSRNIEEQQHASSDAVITRSRPHHIPDAMDLMSSRSVVDFPLSVLTCGLPPTPVIFPAQLVVSDLNIYIRAKLFLMRAMLPDYCRFAVRDGALLIEHPFQYLLRLTLTALDETSEWKVLECQLLVAAHPDYSHDSEGWDWGVIETELVQAIARVLVRDSDGPTTATTTTAVATTAATTTAVALVADNNSLLGSATQPVLPVAGSVEPGNNNNNNPLRSSCTFSLLRVIQICDHVAAAASLRMLHRQAEQFCRTGVFRGGCAVVEYAELTDCSQLCVGFWKSVFSGASTLELRVSLPRVPTPHRGGGGGGASCLQTSLTMPGFASESEAVARAAAASGVNMSTAIAANVADISHAAKDNSSSGGDSSTAFSACTGEFEQCISAMRCLEGGCFFPRFFDDVLALCVRIKVDSLCRRIKASMMHSSFKEVRRPDLSQPEYYCLLPIFNVQTSDACSIVLNRRDLSGEGWSSIVQVRIMVDVRQSFFKVDYSLLGPLVCKSPRALSDFELFTAEINNVFSEQHFANHFIRCRSGSRCLSGDSDSDINTESDILCPPLSTWELIAKHMEMAALVNKFQDVLAINNISDVLVGDLMADLNDTVSSSSSRSSLNAGSSRVVGDGSATGRQLTIEEVARRRKSGGITTSSTTSLRRNETNRTSNVAESSTTTGPDNSYASGVEDSLGEKAAVAARLGFCIGSWESLGDEENKTIQSYCAVMPFSVQPSSHVLPPAADEKLAKGWDSGGGGGIAAAVGVAGGLSVGGAVSSSFSSQRRQQEVVSDGSALKRRRFEEMTRANVLLFPSRYPSKQQAFSSKKELPVAATATTTTVATASSSSSSMRTAGKKIHPFEEFVGGSYSSVQRQKNSLISVYIVLVVDSDLLVDVQCIVESAQILPQDDPSATQSWNDDASSTAASSVKQLSSTKESQHQQQQQLRHRRNLVTWRKRRSLFRGSSDDFVAYSLQRVVGEAVAFASRVMRDGATLSVVALRLAPVQPLMPSEGWLLVDGGSGGGGARVSSIGSVPRSGGLSSAITSGGVSSAWLKAETAVRIFVHHGVMRGASGGVGSGGDACITVVQSSPDQRSATVYFVNGFGCLADFIGDAAASFDEEDLVKPSGSSLDSSLNCVIPREHLLFDRTRFSPDKRWNIFLVLQLSIVVSSDKCNSEETEVINDGITGSASEFFGERVDVNCKILHSYTENHRKRYVNDSDTDAELSCFIDQYSETTSLFVQRSLSSLSHLQFRAASDSDIDVDMIGSSLRSLLRDVWMMTCYMDAMLSHSLKILLGKQTSNSSSSEAPLANMYMTPIHVGSIVSYSSAGVSSSSDGTAESLNEPLTREALQRGYATPSVCFAAYHRDTSASVPASGAAAVEGGASLSASFIVADHFEVFAQRTGCSLLSDVSTTVDKGIVKYSIALKLSVSLALDRIRHDAIKI